MYYYCVGQGVYETLRERLHDIFTSTCHDDICGGALYKELASNHLHKLQNFVTLTFNTDGIPVFKSSKYALWPMFLMVNELPYKMRYVCFCVVYMFEPDNIGYAKRTYCLLAFGMVLPNQIWHSS